MPTVLTQAVDATADTWLVALPSAAPGRQHGSGPGPGGVTCPTSGGDLPPASVTDPDADGSRPVPTADDVQHTLQHLTDGLTDDQQHDVGSRRSPTPPRNLLDAVGDVGNTIAGDARAAPLDDLGSALPTALPTTSP